MGFLQDAGAWILMPGRVTFEASEDGESYRMLGLWSIEDICKGLVEARTLEELREHVEDRHRGPGSAADAVS